MAFLILHLLMVNISLIYRGTPKISLVILPLVSTSGHFQKGLHIYYSILYKMATYFKKKYASILNIRYMKTDI